MNYYLRLLALLAGFVIIAVSTGQIAKLFQRVRLPLITGLLVMGIISGPFILNLIPQNATRNLGFVNDLSLSFIAFAAGSELYLSELRSRMKSIKWMTFGQLVVTFVMSSILVFLIADIIPFMQDLTTNHRIAVSMLIGTIFVARSPASAIAVINELRAKGHFTQIALGVTVLKDVLVIILFTICFSVAGVIIHGYEFRISILGLLILELAVSFGLGFALGKLLGLILKLRLGFVIKIALILLSGWSVYGLSHLIRETSAELLDFEIYLEPLLICITGSFVVANYSSYRPEFLKIIDETGPYIYVAFFTFTGAAISIEILVQSWSIALTLFSIRLVTMIIGSFIGGVMGKMPKKFNRIGWMPYVTQAGVALGLITVVSGEYPEWGLEFATIMISVIVLNQIVGPPLFKWSINLVKESHVKAKTPEFDGIRDAIIFGLEGQSLALARQLQKEGWMVKIATRRNYDDLNITCVPVIKIPGFTKEVLKTLGIDKTEAIVTLNTDDENFRLCELVYEEFGVNLMIVRLNDRKNLERFKKLDAIVVDPSIAMVNLLDHLVRSPLGTSILLGMEEQDTIDIEVRNPNLQGLSLRDLRLPADTLVISIQRYGRTVLSHGYTRLRLGDKVTIVGSVDSLKKVSLKFE